MKLVAHNGSHVWGGNEKWLSMVTEALLRRGHEVVVSCRGDGIVAERLNRAGVRTTSVRPGGDLDLFSLARFAAWLRRERPDAVLATSWNRLPAVAAACRVAGAPCLVVRQGIVRRFPGWGPTRWVLSRGTRAVIANSEEILREWRETAPAEVAGRMVVIHNAIAEPAEPPAGAREAIRGDLGVGPDSRLIAGVGHLYPRKGFDVLISALARLRNPATHLAIAGSGPHEAELRAQAAALGVASRVHWLGFRPDVADILGACDAFVLSSRNEGMANAMLEAMAAGVPVVATAVSGVEFALGTDAEGRAGGWIVPPDEPEAMATAIASVLFGPTAEVAARVAEARRRIRTHFTPKRMVDEVESVLFPRA